MTWILLIAVVVSLACAGAAICHARRAERRADEARRFYLRHLREATQHAITEQRADWARQQKRNAR